MGILRGEFAEVRRCLSVIASWLLPCDFAGHVEMLKA
jgi:hypothetical protein